MRCDAGLFRFCTNATASPFSRSREDAAVSPFLDQLGLQLLEHRQEKRQLSRLEVVVEGSFRDPGALGDRLQRSGLVALPGELVAGRSHQ
jgi:hypothetical protein